MFRLAINMRRINPQAGSIFLISNFLTFNGRLSWETEPRTQENPHLWSCLLNSEQEADEFLTALQPYALTASKISSIRTPGKYRVGICLHTFGITYVNPGIDVKQRYKEKLTALILFLRNQVRKAGIDWMKVCYLADSDTYLPVLAIEYTGYFAQLYEKGFSYDEVCKTTITNVFNAMIEKLELHEAEATALKNQFNSSIYSHKQKDVSYLMFDFSILPTLLQLSEKINRMAVNNIVTLFFAKANGIFPREIEEKIAGLLTVKDASNLVKSFKPTESAAEPPAKRAHI